MSGDEKMPPVSLSRSADGQQGLSAALEDAFAELAGKYDPSQYDRVQVFVDTHDTVFVPQEFLNVELKELLKDAGIEAGAEDVIISADSVDGVGAAAVFRREPIELLQRMFGGRLTFLSPMHELLTACRLSGGTKECMALYPTSCNIYMAQFDEIRVLVLAEVYQCSCEADAVYYCSQLIGAQKAHRTKILIYGERALRYAGCIKRYFKKVAVLRNR